MAAPTTPATPVQVYALAQGAQFGIPKPLADLNIPTKDEVDTAVANGKTLLADGSNTTVTGTGTATDKYKVTVVPSALVAASSPNGLKVSLDGKLYVEVKPDSKLELDGVNYKHTNESGVATVIEPGQFIAAVVGNALTTAPDGRLVIQIPAQFPDDQVFSGDGTGTVELVLTPVTVGDQVNYTIKADLKIAATNPDGSANKLKWGASGFYVELKDVFCE